MKIAIALVFILMVNLLHAQQILIDRGIQASGLWCFPTVDDSLQFYYLPAEVNLAKDKDGKPQFSMIRYVMNDLTGDSGANSIQKAQGGAILNFLIAYETPKNQIEKAQNALRQTLANDSVVVRGPVIFSKGNYSLVSSIISQNGTKHNMLMAAGSAPVLEGNKLALSFKLSPETSRLLLESFQMATPDISVVFDLEFQGLSDAFDADMQVNWSKVNNSNHLKAGAKIYYVGAELDMLYKDLISEQAIVLNTRGEDERMEAIINRAYDKLTSLFFQPVEQSKIPEPVKEDIAGTLGKVVSKITKSIPIQVQGAYTMRKLKTSGYSRFDFHSQSTLSRHHMLVFNIGNLYQKYGSNPNYFKTVSMDDPDFQQRVIHVGVDGDLMSEFHGMVNSVTVTLKKEHQNGEVSLKELVLTPVLLSSNKPELSMVYGSKMDTDRLKWLDYQYRTIWKFTGGGTWESPWQQENSSMINLYVPYKRMPVELLGDEAQLIAAGVKALIVQVKYPFFGQQKNARLVWKAGEMLGEKSVEITLPVATPEYTCRLTYLKKDGSRIVKEIQDNTGFVVVDELSE